MENARLNLTSKLTENRLWYSNTPEAVTNFGWLPDSFEVQVKLEGTISPDLPLLLEVVTTAGEVWGLSTANSNQLEAGITIKCQPVHAEAPGDLSLRVRATKGNSLENSSPPVYSNSLTMQVGFIGHSGFDPARNGYSFVNTSEVYGPVSLDPEMFRQTYGFSFGKDALYKKMYRDILGATTDVQGQSVGGAPLSNGLCTGMIRSAIYFFQEKANPPASQRQPVGDTLNTIKLYHGKQLTDRALLQGASWIVRGSPRAVFEAFVKEIKRGNRDPFAFDIGMAALNRKDFFKAIQAEGHTVIPYAVRQPDQQHGEIFIYDPNLPPLSHDYGYANAPITMPFRLTGPAIKFNLADNTYYYTDRYTTTRPNGDHTVVVAVHQSAYRKGKSALLAGIANRFI